MDALLKDSSPAKQNSYVASPTAVSSIRTHIHFCISDKVGALDEVLAVLKSLNVSLTRIESRPSKNAGDYDFFVDFKANAAEHVAQIVAELSKTVKEIKVVSTETTDKDANASNNNITVPWFPRKKIDLDTFAEKVLSYGAVRIVLLGKMI